MTVLVGVKCVDGIVIGADSIATSAGGAGYIMQIQSSDKIVIQSNGIIVAATGSVGYAQRLNHHVSEAVRGSVFANLNKIECATNITKRMLSDLQNSQAQNYSQGGIRFGALIAAVVKGGEHCLIEYGTADFQPEFKEDKLFYVSTGSGQSLADPFLAFVDRVLWNNTMPTVELGKLGVMWVLQHTIRFAPGGVGGSPSMAILKRVDGRWIASKLTIDELQESAQYTNQLEEHIKGFALGGIQNAETAALPIPPAQNA